MIAKINEFEINSIHEGDAWKICDFCNANEDRLKRYFPKTLELNLNPTLSKIFVDNKVKSLNNKNEFLFTLKHSENRALIALIYIKDVNWHSKQGEFAYAIDYNFSGKGLISKSVLELSQYAFRSLGLECLKIITHKDNIPSVRVALNNGFKWQRTLENEFTPPGEQPLNMELYELYK